MLTSHLFEVVWCGTWWIFNRVQLFQEKEELCGPLLQGPFTGIEEITALIKGLTFVTLQGVASCSALMSKYVGHLPIAPGLWTVNMVEPWYYYLQMAAKIKLEGVNSATHNQTRKEQNLGSSLFFT